MDVEYHVGGMISDGGVGVGGHVIEKLLAFFSVFSVAVDCSLANSLRVWGIVVSVALAWKDPMTCWRYFTPSASRAGLLSGGEVCFVMLFRIVLDSSCMGNAVVWKGGDDYNERV
eukprot:scaffold2378_cov55-Cyclotella_meneghiniana.AAC.1